MLIDSSNRGVCKYCFLDTVENFILFKLLPLVAMFIKFEKKNDITCECLKYILPILVILVIPRFY